MATIKQDTTKLFQNLQGLLGRSVMDPDVRRFLSMYKKQPFEGFLDEEFSRYLTDKENGYSLLFQDAQVLDNDFSISKEPRLPVFAACFFYPGDVEDFERFNGSLPLGISWSDDVACLSNKLGRHKSEILDKETGVVASRRWVDNNCILIAKFKPGTTALRHLFYGLI